MSISREEISRAVQDVLGSMKSGHTPEGKPLPPPPAPRSGRHLRRRGERGHRGQGSAASALCQSSLALRYDIIAQMRVVLRHNAEFLSWMAREETGLGRYEDKIEKNLLVINKTPGPEDLEPLVTPATTGSRSWRAGALRRDRRDHADHQPHRDHHQQRHRHALGGNAVVFNAHPNAKNCSANTVAAHQPGDRRGGRPAQPHHLRGRAHHRERAGAHAPQAGEPPGGDRRPRRGEGGDGQRQEAPSPPAPAIRRWWWTRPPTSSGPAATSSRRGSFDNNIVCTTEKEVIAWTRWRTG